MADCASDLFGSVAEDYAAFRPTYPEPFFSAFAARCPSLQRVWDCGCGSGQASIDLAKHFEHVEASDASAAQLSQAPSHPRIHYRQVPAHACGLAPASVDGVLVAAAVHWFAGDAFNQEVRRVAKPGAAMAWIGYLPLQLEREALQSHIDHFYETTLKPWWAPERRWVDDSYAGLPFPGEEWPFPKDWWIERRWTLAELVGYFRTWSAVEQATRDGFDPLPALIEELQELWPGQGSEAITIRWPFMGRWGLITACP